MTCLVGRLSIGLTKRPAAVVVRAQGDGEKPSTSSAPSPPSRSPARSGELPPMDPVEIIKYGYRIPSRRRVLGSVVSGTAIALGGNLFGVTSSLLALDDGKFAESTGLDTLVPVAGFKRARDLDNGYSFLYPAEWLADQRLYYAYAAEIERRASLDPPSLRAAQRRSSNLPTAAFGPAGSTGEVNVSVIAAGISPGFRLQQLGGPERAARSILANNIAPEGSGKVATLISFSERNLNGVDYYSMEYEVKGPTFHRRNVSTYTSRDGYLFTLNAQCPVEKWSELETKLRKSAESFALLGGSRGSEFVQRL